MHYVNTSYAKLRGASCKIPRASQLSHSDNSQEADWGCDQRKIVETEGGPANATHYSRKSIFQRGLFHESEAGKRRLAVDTARAATSGEVKYLRREARALKDVVAEQALDLRLLKKSMIADGDGEE